PELRDEAIWLRETAARLRRLSTDIPVALLEQAAIAGAVTPDVDRATAAAQTLVQRLDAISPPAERGWKVVADARGLTLARTVRGVAELHTLNTAALRSAEARWLAERAAALEQRFRDVAMLKL